MSPYDICIWVAAIGGPACLLHGVMTLIFGTTTQVSGSKSKRIELKFLGNEVSVPWAPSIVTTVVGLLLIFGVIGLSKGGADKAASIRWFPEALAQASDSPSAVPGWVYFGPEREPREWNFDLIGGTYTDLRSGKSSMVLKAVRAVSIREDHFGDFTGTFLGFVNPEPKRIGTLPAGACALAKETVSVGISKIWVRIIPAQCPR